MSQNPVLAPENITDAPFAAPFEVAPSEVAGLDASHPKAILSRRALLGVGALVGAALCLPALPARADFGYSDVKALRLLEEIAGLEADFFAKAAISAPADGLQEPEMNAINLIARQDNELMRWFKAARGRYGISAFDKFYSLNQASSRPLPSYRFGAATSNTRAGLFSRAIEIKTVAVGAFHGAVGQADDAKLVQAFAALAGVQGRHLAMLQELNGQTPFTPLESAISLREAATKLSEYGFNAEVLG
ncbi:Ferritin-like domain-containing protein [Abditibacterium utsteinense]|uniref:Ferritin-like domain-containing protein n=1 Tax=Abditibacterium utsteinense TaxID=1960156 RepID=A0A2S8STV8_9BACT|nr:ferritin-like domain-containing protein [Abditibacterium utsteinense]PQV64243.1 Ferritin-like domain-containing protein [Abditibacterium utsteinense]